MKKRQTILIVDDEKVNRVILKNILSQKYDILEAENGLEAWEILQDNKSNIAAILLDIVMPKMNGYEFLAKLKQASMTELPVIVTTGEHDIEVEQKALDAGAWDFVSKPYAPEVLTVRLRNAIARRQVSVYEKIQEMAGYDPLTGLYNRERTFSEIRELLDENLDTTFLFIRADIDKFALYNSAFGEEAGDKLLCFIAEQFKKLADEYPLIVYGRISGDVFCACLPYLGTDENLNRKVDGVQKILAQHRKDYRVEISVGAYIVEDHSLSVEECYLRASLASQKCKNKYGRHVAFYDQEYIKKAAQEVAIEVEMKQALEEEQFVVYLQPKVYLPTDTACGAEALVRWQHPTKGMISPGEFIPVFERNGFIADLDYYVWERTCQILRKWLDEKKKIHPISVNVSRISLYNPRLVDLLVELIRKYEIEPLWLQLEVTESAYMTNPELMQETIRQLKAAGFTILMDDFGSGYSSLNTLKDIDVDILKLDMKFLPTTGEASKGEIILDSMIQMGGKLGMQVVVEGVETLLQRNFLEGAGCDYVQGYYYSKPIPVEEFEEKFVKTEEEELLLKRKTQARIIEKNETILVIDDSETDRSILANYFKDKFVVHGCSSAEEALVYLRYNHKSVKVILVDNFMDGMSGIDFLTYCKNIATLDLIPKIMITASDSVEDQLNAFRNGAYDYITKPFNMEIVEARLNHILGKSL